MPCPANELGGIVPFVAVFVAMSERQAPTSVAAWCVDGARVLVARSGTACRAPTVGNGNCKRTTSALSRLRNSWVVATWGTVRNACATEKRFRPEAKA